MMRGGGLPVIVLDTNTKREQGRKAQLSNIQAAETVASIIKTCLGPRAMLKMVLDAMGGIVLTNDGNCILREIDVAHPAAKSMLEISRTQDEEVGDGTTSVIILAGEVLSTMAPFLDQQLHPVTIISALRKGLKEALQVVADMAIHVDVNDDEKMIDLLKTTIGTKFVNQWATHMCTLALKAVRTVAIKDEDGHFDVDIKRFARVEKIPGGQIDDSEVLDGILINKDVTHPKMRRHIENPRILLVDCPLEYKKGESKTDIEITDVNHFQRLLEIEEEQIKSMCDKIISLKPDIVMTEKGLSDLAQHYLVKANITALRRLKKTDNVRVARACGARIVNQIHDATEEDIGTGAGLFYVDKIGDEYFSYVVKCKDPKACTILLRGASKDVLNEVERNLTDALCVARNIFYDPMLVPGGGATEMAISVALNEKARAIEGVEQWPFSKLAKAFEVIPRILVQNCGGNAIKVLTELRAKYAQKAGNFWGINGNTGEVADVRELNIWEPRAVKIQTIKSAVESACLLLRVDDIVSGVTKRSKQQSQPQPDQVQEDAEMMEK